MGGISPWPEVSGTIEFTMYPDAAAWFRDFFARADRAEWIEGVKRRLGLITPEDNAAARLRQWQHDHLTSEDLPAVLRTGARELDAALTLELHDQCVPEAPARPHPAARLAWQYWPALWPEPATDWLPSGYLRGQE